MTGNGWKKTRLKYVADVNREVISESTSPETEFLYIDIANVTQGNVSMDVAPIRFSDSPSRARRLAETGDTVVSTVRTYLRAVAPVPSSMDKLVFSTGFAVFHPAETVVPGYLSWYLQGDDFVSRVEASSVGVSYPATTAAALSSMNLYLPPFEEQRSIAEYLDRETQKIDELITEQRELIEILRERRRAVIAEASTRGIDRSATFVDSHVSWVGLTPSHWVRSRHSTVLHEVKRVVGDDSSGLTLLSLTKRGVIPRDLTEGKGKFPASFETYQWVERDQIVFCLFDIDETPRTVGLVRQRGMLTGAYDVFDVNFSIADPAYLEYYFIGIDDEKRFRPLYTGLRKVIQKPRFKVAQIMLPPLSEQKAIVAYLDDQTMRIDKLISESENLIAFSEEWRSALITAAVTGQIDVRTTS